MAKVVDFADMSAFETAISKGTEGSLRTDERGIDICTLKPSYIYRSGDLSEFSFFSDRMTIAPYEHSSRQIIKYKTPTRLKLMVFNWKNINAVINTLPAEMRQIFDDYIADADNKTIFPSKPIEDTYMNKVFAMLVCELGYRGWIAKPDCDVQQQNIDFANSDIPNGVIVYKTNPYYPEIMLCKPDAERIVRSAGARTRKRKIGASETNKK